MCGAMLVTECAQNGLLWSSQLYYFLEQKRIQEHDTEQNLFENST